MLAAETVAVNDKELVIRADRDLFARLFVIRDKREISMKDLLRYSLGPFAGSLATPITNVYKSTKSDLLTCLEKKINLVNQISADAARLYDGMCFIRQLPTALILSEIYLIMSSRGLHPIAQLSFFSSLINTRRRQLNLVSATSGVEVDP